MPFDIPVGYIIPFEPNTDNIIWTGSEWMELYSEEGQTLYKKLCEEYKNSKDVKIQTS